MHVTEDNNAEFFFSKAEELLDLNKAAEAQDYIRKGLAKGIDYVPFFDIFEEKIKTGRTITFICPRKGSYSKEMILDGMSFYSYLLEATIEFLLSSKHIHQIVSLENVTYLSDIGPISLLNLQNQAKEVGGEIKYANACKAVKQLADKYMEWERQEYPRIYHSVSDAIADFHESK